MMKQPRLLHKYVITLSFIIVHRYSDYISSHFPTYQIHHSIPYNNLDSNLTNGSYYPSLPTQLPITLCLGYLQNFDKFNDFLYRYYCNTYIKLIQIITSNPISIVSLAEKKTILIQSQLTREVPTQPSIMHVYMLYLRYITTI